MTQEEKQLLLIDLCARLPYGVICRLSAKGADVSVTEKLDLGGLEHFIVNTMDVLPYLRPMSSMTEEEKEKFESLVFTYDFGNVQFPIEHVIMYWDSFEEVLDWLNAHHFDYRGLIPMGLALEAKEGMYKSE